MDLRNLIGSANIRANITANGQPIQLPPEVVNQLLNQHFLRNGGLPDLLAGAVGQPQPQQQGRMEQQQQEGGERSEGRGEGRQTNTGPARQASGQQLFQQFMASVNEASRQGTPVGGAEARRGQDGSRSEGHEERGRSHTQGVNAGNAPVPPEEAPPALDGEATSRNTATADPPSQAQAQAGTNGPAFQERSGVNPDGSRWTIRTSTVQHPHPHHHHHHHHGAPQPPQPQPQFPGMPFPLPFPQGFPFPQPQNGMPMPIPIPMAAPIANLRPQNAAGTPRSASPARSISEGPNIRRIGTPASDLQTRLQQTNAEIANLNTLLTLLSSGTTASGSPAPPLSTEQLNQIRTYAESMNNHIEGFGGDLERLAMAHPGVRGQPEFVGLQGLFGQVLGQGRGVGQRIEGLFAGAGGGADAAGGGGANVNGEMMGVAFGGDGTGGVAGAPQRDAPTPSTNSDTLSPSLITRETSPADPASTAAASGTTTTSSTTTAPAPTTTNTTATSTTQPTPSSSLPSTPELHLLSNPTNTQHYLLIGPNNLNINGMGALPLEILYPLLAARVPHEQLVRDFNRAMGEMVHALQRADFRQGLYGGLNLPALGVSAVGSANGSGSSTAARAGAGGVNTAAPPAAVTGSPQAPAQAQAQPGIAAPAAPPRAGVANPQPNAPPPGVAPRQQQAQPDNNEIRDALAPIVRNLWLLVRLAIFGWFFFSSGRGYGRLLLLLGVGAVVYALNQGLLGRRVEGVVEGVRRHFGEVVEEARGQRPIVQEDAVAAGGVGEGRAGGGVGSPEEAARRMMVRNAQGQRRQIWNQIRRLERTIALAVASLWPGVGEAVVRNAERQRREQEQRIEEERRQVEEERRRRQEEEQKRKDEVGVVETTGEGSSGREIGEGGVERVNKGKERADTQTGGGDVD